MAQHPTSTDEAQPGGAATGAERDDAAVRRGRLSRDRIVATGLAFIDEHGLAGLSMRRLGTRLGVEAMALYRYTSSKEDLLDAIVDRMVDEMRSDPDLTESPATGWQDFLQRLAHAVRRVALAHPLAFPLVVSRPPEAPWLRPPLRSLAWVETFLSGLVEEGFSDDGAVEAYRVFTSFLLGYLLLEVAVHGADIGPLDTLEETTPQAGLEEFPTVRRLRPVLERDNAAAEFEEALEKLLERLELVRAEHPRQA